jgi:hypothetical protein
MMKESRQRASTDTGGIPADESRANTDIIGQPAQQPQDRTSTDMIGARVGPAAPTSGPAGQPQPGLDNGQPAAAGPWVETPVIAPGDVLNLDLLIDPANPYRKQSCAIIIHSRSIEAGGATAPASDPATIQIKGVSWFWRVPPVVVTALLLIALIIGVVYITAWRLTGLDLLNWMTWL